MERLWLAICRLFKQIQQKQSRSKRRLVMLKASSYLVL